MRNVHTFFSLCHFPFLFIYWLFFLLLSSPTFPLYTPPTLSLLPPPPLSQYLPSLFSPLCSRSVASQWDFPSETWSEGWKQEAGDPDWLSLTFGVALSAAHFSFTLLLSLHTSCAFLFHYFLFGFPFLSSVFRLLVLHLFLASFPPFTLNSLSLSLSYFFLLSLFPSASSCLSPCLHFYITYTFLLLPSCFSHF